MKILITGTGGFIGGNLINYLDIQGYEVIGIERFSKKITQTNNPKKYKIYNVDLENIKLLCEIIESEKPDVCIHCAGSSSVQASINFPYEDFSQTVLTTRNLLEALRMTNVKAKFIYLSSAAVYGNPVEFPITENTRCNPISPYGFNKLIAENLILEYSQIHGIEFTVLRLFSVYGNGLKRQVIHDVMEKFLKSCSETISLFGSGEESRDFIHVHDVINSIKMVLKYNLTGVYNIASGQSVKIRELAELIKEETKSEKEITFKGVPRKGDPMYWSVDISKICKKGFAPKVSLKEGVHKYYEWFVHQY